MVQSSSERRQDGGSAFNGFVFAPAGSLEAEVLADCQGTEEAAAFGNVADPGSGVLVDRSFLSSSVHRLRFRLSALGQNWVLYPDGFFKYGPSVETSACARR